MVTGQWSCPAGSLAPTEAQTFCPPCHPACGTKASPPGTNDIPVPSVYGTLVTQGTWRNINSLMLAKVRKITGEKAEHGKKRQR